MLNLVKFFISTNLALRVLENEYLKRIICPSIELKCVKTLRYTILPQVLRKLKLRIAEKCEDAVSIVLIPDGWTSPQMAEYLGFFNNFFPQLKSKSQILVFKGLGAVLMKSNFEKEFVILGLQRVLGGHGAENMKKYIEEIVNAYKFDKNRIKV